MKILLGRFRLLMVAVFILATNEIAEAQYFTLTGKVTGALSGAPVAGKYVIFSVNTLKTDSCVTNAQGVYTKEFDIFSGIKVEVHLISECVDYQSTESITFISSNRIDTANFKLCNHAELPDFEYEIRTQDRTLLLTNLTDTTKYTGLKWNIDGDQALQYHSQTSYNSDTVDVLCLYAERNERKYIRCKEIEISGKNTISGNILAGNQPLESGTAYLIGADKAINVIRDTFTVTDGAFKISGIENGNYGLYIVPDYDFQFLHYPHYLPTYFGDTYRWDEMLRLQITKNQDDIDVSLLSYVSPYYGTCTIQGTFFPTDTLVMNVENINVLLLDDSKTPIDFRIVNEAPGFYRFPHLPFGTYYIHAEGLNKNVEDYKVVLSKENENTDIDFDYNNDQIIVRQKGSVATLDSEIELYIYQKIITINTKQAIEKGYIVELFDLSGRLISQQAIGLNTQTIKIDARSCATGIYLLSFIQTETLLRENVKLYLTDK